MSDYLLSRYGARIRLHQTVATIATIIFNTDVSADRVKKQLKRAAR
jgi:hypothetical protein